MKIFSVAAEQIEHFVLEVEAETYEEALQLAKLGICKSAERISTSTKVHSAEVNPTNV